MQHNVNQQQNLLTKSFIKQYCLCCLFVFLVAVASYSNLKANHLAISLIQYIFDRYNICFGLIPTLIIVLLSTLKVSLNDVLCCQTRQVIAMQFRYRIVINTIFIALVWLTTMAVLIFITNNYPSLMSILLSVLIRTVYFVLVLTEFGFITATVYLIIGNRLVTFFIVFSINCFAFALNVNKKPSLFYDFINSDFKTIVLSRMVILLVSLAFFNVMLNRVIKKKDFL